MTFKRGERCPCFRCGAVTYYPLALCIDCAENWGWSKEEHDANMAEWKRRADTLRRTERRVT